MHVCVCVVCTVAMCLLTQFKVGPDRQNGMTSHNSAIWIYLLWKQRVNIQQYEMKIWKLPDTHERRKRTEWENNNGAQRQAHRVEKNRKVENKIWLKNTVRGAMMSVKRIEKRSLQCTKCTTYKLYLYRLWFVHIHNNLRRTYA